MELKDKAGILVEFITAEFSNPLYEDFFNFNDLGIPLAVAVDADLCVLTDDGKDVLNETYELLCNELGIDNKDYDSYDDMLREMPKD